ALAWLYFLEQIVGLIQYYNVPKDIRDYNAAISYISNVVFGAILILYLAVYIFVVFKYARIPILIVCSICIFLYYIYKEQKIWSVKQMKWSVS
ncbi:unnamed protein product, partial [Rotaria sp. Silwood1]